MLHGRDKVGADVTATLSQLTVSKPKRLTFPFGPALTDTSVRSTAHEHNIREISLSGGALGCALWDGGVVLSRWIYANGGVFYNKRVLELGCGVGLAGILAAHWAEHVTLTDYVNRAVANAEYNARLNSHDAELDGEEDGAVVSGAPYRYSIIERMAFEVVDWNIEMALDLDPDAEKEELTKPLCTRSERSGNVFREQPWFHCRTCWTEGTMGCCQSCAIRCHAGHDVVHPGEISRFKCDCSDGCVAQPRPSIEPVDIIIGAELTYNLLSCEALAHVVDKWLKPDGVFYEVLSNDRDGVTRFIEAIESRGFVTVRHDAPPHLVGKFGTRKWSKQDDETYSLYTWRRRRSSQCSEHDAYPDMC